MTLLASLKTMIGRKPTESQEQRKLLDAKLERLIELRTRNRLAKVNSELDKLESKGVPFDREEDPAPSPILPPSYHPVYVYEKDEKTGFPYKPSVVFEQDPLFGWGYNSLLDWDFSTEVPVSAFPREMFPERATSLRTQVANDAVRYQSRNWFETLPQYSGPLGHLRNFVIGAGMTWDVVTKKKAAEKLEQQRTGKRPEPDEEATESEGAAEQDTADEALAAEIQDFLNGFAVHKKNRLQRRLWDSVLNLFRDGEDALRLRPGEEYPELRTVDTSWIRGPHNEITGPWAYGVLTSWPDDYEDVKAYHIWKADNSKEFVSPEEMKLCKLDTTGSNVKRGVPLAYKIRKQLPQLAKLLDCMAVGEAARQAIPYFVVHSLADKSAVKAATPSALEALDSCFAGDGHRRRDEIRPGEIPHIDKGQDYRESPAGSSGQGGVLTYRALCEAIACALNVPLWFVTGSSDSENYASSIVSESPVTKLIIHYQGIVTDHFSDVMGAAVDMSARFPENWRERVTIHTELPAPVSRDTDKAIDTDLKLLDKKLLSPQHLCTRNNIDFHEEQDLIGQAELDGWENTTVATESPSLPGDDDNGQGNPNDATRPRSPHPGE